MLGCGLKELENKLPLTLCDIQNGVVGHMAWCHSPQLQKDCQAVKNIFQRGLL